MTRLCHPTTLFVSPKRGGILQSSGFLDLKCLMALNRTCKANMIDELSLILLIENEITWYHGVTTMKEAIKFWRIMCDEYPWLKRWIERDGSTASMMASEEAIYNEHVLREAVFYEVMLAKMLQTIPTESERLRLVNERDGFGMTLLHLAAELGNPGSINTILALYPESERLQALNVTCDNGWTILHCVARSGSIESLKVILALFPEAERVHAVQVQDESGRTALHHAINSKDIECIKAILTLIPKAERIRDVSMQDHLGWTALHYATQFGNSEIINTILTLCPESEPQRRETHHRAIK